jgi:hypothetical protein
MKEQKKSIISDVIESRIKKEALNVSIENAKKELPIFKEKINQLILKRVPKPVVKEIKYKSFAEYLQSDLRNTNFLFEPVEMRTNTVLESKIVTDKGKIDVLVACSEYPAKENKKDINYTINVSDIDHTLEIDEKGARLKSKARESHIPDNPIIGRAYPSWPKWERELNMKDLTRYSELIDMLGSSLPSIEFTGRTPEIIKPIYPKGKISEMLMPRIKP